MAELPDIAVRIGALRWPVVIARRRQNFEPGGVGIFEDLVEIETVRAEVVPINASTFYGAEAVDTPVSHRITVRWLGYLDDTNVVVRDTKLPDGETRHEVFRVRRVKELNGRKRFTSIDAELERVTLGSAR